MSENAKSTVDPQYTGKMFVVEDFGTPIKSSYTPKGSGSPTNAEITPLRLRDDGMIEIKAIVPETKTTPPLSQEEAIRQQFLTKGKLSAPDADGRYTVTYSSPREHIDKVPFTGDIKDQIERRLPSIKGFKLSNKEAVNAVKRRTKDGRIAIFNADTKEFISYE